MDFYSITKQEQNGCDVIQELKRRVFGSDGSEVKKLDSSSITIWTKSSNVSKTFGVTADASAAIVEMLSCASNPDEVLVLTAVGKRMSQAFEAATSATTKLMKMNESYKDVDGSSIALHVYDSLQCVDTWRPNDGLLDALLVNVERPVLAVALARWPFGADVVEWASQSAELPSQLSESTSQRLTIALTELRCALLGIAAVSAPEPTYQSVSRQFIVDNGKRGRGKARRMRRGGGPDRSNANKPFVAASSPDQAYQNANNAYRGRGQQRGIRRGGGPRL